MSLLIKGITRISELEIDADKDMTVHGLFNLKEVVAAMARGDIPVRDINQLVVVPAGSTDYVFTSTGQGKIPVWAPAGGGLKYYFPVVIGLTDTEDIVAADQAYNKNAPIASEHVQVYVDTPAENVKRLDKTIVSIDAEAIVPVDQSYNKDASVARDISIPIDGCVYEPNGAAQVDQTANAQSAAVDDIILNPMTPAAGDIVYFGFQKNAWPRMWFNLSTQGVGNWTNVWEYWNGAWVAVVGEIDMASEWQATAGINRIQWTPQGDWAPSIIMLMNLYWVRSRTTNFVNQITPPLGAQAFCCLPI